VKVHLHLTDGGKPVFHAEKPAVREVQPHHHGFRGWIERKAKSLKEAWSHADHGAAGKVRALWDKLQRRMPADESTLIHLRAASAIEIHHPAAMSSEEARSHWVDYLARCRRRHLPWLWFNALLSPVTLLLAPLPGPNLIGYWFAYRAVRDILALMGVRHARNSQVVTTFHATNVFSTYAGAGPIVGAAESSWHSESGSGGVAFAALAAGRPPSS
jgi:hypothetical protein